MPTHGNTHENTILSVRCVEIADTHDFDGVNCAAEDSLGNLTPKQYAAACSVNRSMRDLFLARETTSRITLRIEDFDRYGCPQTPREVKRLYNYTRLKGFFDAYMGSLTVPFAHINTPRFFRSLQENHYMQTPEEVLFMTQDAFTTVPFDYQSNPSTPTGVQVGHLRLTDIYLGDNDFTEVIRWIAQQSFIGNINLCCEDDPETLEDDDIQNTVRFTLNLLHHTENAATFVFNDAQDKLPFVFYLFQSIVSTTDSAVAFLERNTAGGRAQIPYLPRAVLAATFDGRFFATSERVVSPEEIISTLRAHHRNLSHAGRAPNWDSRITVMIAMQRVNNDDPDVAQRHASDLESPFVTQRRRCWFLSEEEGKQPRRPSSPTSVDVTGGTA